MDTENMDTKKTMTNDEGRMIKWGSFPFTEILGWYQKNGRHDLPWRQVYNKPVKERLYRVWIAEVMLQQTQVDRVIGYYLKFLEKYPTIESLAATTYDILFPYYQGLGYYGRARRMIELAKTVVVKYDGIFPDNFEKLRKLPGIGEYTAQALLAFGYDKALLAVDANLQKIFSRYYYGSKYIFGIQKTKYKGQNDKLLEQLEQQLQKENISGREINNALMDFGALVSTSFDKIDWKNYPLKNCLWLQSEGKQEVIKKKTIRRSEKGAKLVVFLHEAHKLYWSSAKSHYEPFLIEPTSRDDRRTVQDYFSATFGLEVSVRPSFSSGKYDGIPVKLFHAQIQTGTLKQKTFSKKEKEIWLHSNGLLLRK